MCEKCAADASDDLAVLQQRLADARNEEHAAAILTDDAIDRMMQLVMEHPKYGSDETLAEMTERAYKVYNELAGSGAVAAEIILVYGTVVRIALKAIDAEYQKRPAVQRREVTVMTSDVAEQSSKSVPWTGGSPMRGHSQGH